MRDMSVKKSFTNDLKCVIITTKKDFEMKKVEINLDLGRTEINLKDKKTIITKTLTGYNVLYQSSENCDFKEFEGSYKDYVSKLVKNILEGN